MDIKARITTLNIQDRISSLVHGCMCTKKKEVEEMYYKHFLYLLPHDVHVMNPNWQYDIFGT